MTRALLFPLFLLASLPAAAQQVPNPMSKDGSNATVGARTWLGIGAPYGTLWSSLGVVADGTTDNTAALNALPAGQRITADCAAGSFVRLNGKWLLKSNLDIKWQPGCRMVSYYVAPADYAIGQADESVPLTNITLDGITIEKDVWRDTERILRAWINHFRLLNWTVTGPNDGMMFLRGSCQEIAYGRHVSTTFDPGSPGIRHIGNMPKVSDACYQVADFWAHDNNIISGDAAYQSCQPLPSAPWANVSSDDMLWEKNTGKGSSFALIGDDANGAANVYTCNNIVYRNNTGGGRERGYLITSNGNPVTNVIVANQSLDAATSTRTTGFLHIRGDNDPGRPGSFSNILFDGVSVANTHAQAVTSIVPSGGALNGLTIRNGVFDTPSSANQAVIAINGGTDVTLQNNLIHGAAPSAGGAVAIGFDDAASNAGTVTRFAFINNRIDKVLTTSVGLWMRNVAGATVSGNALRTMPGAVAPTTGIKLNAAYALPTSGTGPGATDISMSNNTLINFSSAIAFVCNGGVTNVAAYNLGDVGHTCP